MKYKIEVKNAFGYRMHDLYSPDLKYARKLQREVQSMEYDAKIVCSTNKKETATMNMKTELDRQIEETKLKLASLEERKKQTETKKLFLARTETVLGTTLDVKYGTAHEAVTIARLWGNTGFSVWNNEEAIEAYQQWRDGGFLIGGSVVEFREGRYKITEGGTLRRVDIDGGCIYNFKEQSPYVDCQDPNVKCWPGCNTPIIH